MALTEQKEKIAVVGGGSWATAIVKILSENDLKIRWWMKNQDDVNHFKVYHNNPRYLSHITVPASKVKADNDIERVIAQCSVVIIAVPAAFVKDVLDPLDNTIFQGKIVVSAVKGMIPQDNILVTEYLQQKFNLPINSIAVISGPCHSEEIAMEKRSYLTIAGQDKEVSEKIAFLLKCRFVKTSTVQDLYGIEYGAVMKNVIALACGIARGLNYGDNFQAVLVSNAMQEIRRFIETVNPMPDRDFNASAYLGDVLVTSYSQFSRNRTLGNMVGRGYTVKSALVEMNMVAEGYYGVKCIHEVNKNWDIEMPIHKAVYNILYEKIAPSVEMRILEYLMN